MKIKIEGMNMKEFCKLAKTKIPTHTLFKFGFTGKKGYPTPKGEKYITKNGYNEITINKPIELANAILKQREHQ